jgi:hypothetical protein
MLMDRQALATSGNIKSVGYDAEAQRLEIEFASGGVYTYEHVPPDVHDKLIHAESPGTYFAVWIRAAYNFERQHTLRCGRYLDCNIPMCACWCHKQRKDITNARTQEDKAGTGSVPPWPVEKTLPKKKKGKH